MLLSIKLAVIGVAIYTGVAETVAIYSVIEIGPNLLAAITSLIGAVILIAQIWVASRVTKVKGTAEEAKVTAETMAKVVGDDIKTRPPL